MKFRKKKGKKLKTEKKMVKSKNIYINTILEGKERRKNKKGKKSGGKICKKEIKI